MSEIFTGAAPGEPSPLYARWYRIDETSATDADVARGWQITFAADREFWAELDAAQAGSAALRDGVAALAGRLEASAKATRPSRKSDIESSTAAELRDLLEG